MGASRAAQGPTNAEPRQGHVNNVVYARYAESSRVNWINNFAVHVDPGHRDEWAQLMTPRGVGLILKSLQADFKFVRLPLRRRFAGHRKEHGTQY